MQEKVAHALMLTNVMINADTLLKLAEFETMARARGFSEAKIDTYMKKVADGKLKNILKAVPYLGVGGVAALGAVAHHKGKKSGREEGFSQGVKAYDDAIRNFGL